MEKPGVVEKPLVLIPAPAMAGEALILSLSCHRPRCWCLIDFLCSIRLRSQMGPQGWHVTSSLGLSSFLRGRECQLRCHGNSGQLPPFMHFAASFILRDCQAVRHPTPVLVPGRGGGGGAPFTPTSGSRMLGSTGVEMGGILGFCVLGACSTAGPHLAPAAAWSM